MSEPAITVLLAGHLPWWKQLQTPHYVASLLARRTRVLYIEPKVAWNPGTAAFHWKQNVACFRDPLRKVQENLWVFTPWALPLARWDRVASWNDHIFAMSLRHAVARISSDHLVLWLAETYNSVLVAKVFPDAPRVFHAIDNFIEEHDASAAFELASAAQVVLAATPLIEQSLRRANPHIHLFRNGWDFSGAALADHHLPEEVSRIPHPRVGLVSYLSANLDYALLHRILDELPISLVCIGRPLGTLSRHDRELLRLLRQRPRAFFLGEKATERLPPYLRAFDICIAPYKNNPRIYGSDPLKVYQYLAFGKPVVATPVDVLEPLEPIVRTARTHEEFVLHLKQEVDNPSNERLYHLRRAFGQSTNWETRWTALQSVMAKCPTLAVLCESAGSISASLPDRSPSSPLVAKNVQNVPLASECDRAG